MASGNLFLVLSENIGWEEFPDYAEDFIGKVGGKIIEKLDAVDVRIYKIKLKFVTLRLVYEDYPQMVSLESMDDSGDSVIRELYAEFAAEH